MGRTKTCISSDVVRSDAFLSLSHESQALYFQLNLEADGYGVVTSAAMLMRGCGFDHAALSELEESGFIIPLATESGSPMKVVRHWWEHNNFKGSKTSQSRQMDALKAQVCTVNESRAYSTREECEGMEFSGHDGEVKGIEQAFRRDRQLVTNQLVTSKRPVTNQLLTGKSQSNKSNKTKEKESNPARPSQEEASRERPQVGREPAGATASVVPCPICDQPAAADGITVQCSYCGYDSTNEAAYGKLASL